MVKSEQVRARMRVRAIAWARTLREKTYGICRDKLPRESTDNYPVSGWIARISSGVLEARVARKQVGKLSVRARREKRADESATV